ASAPGVGGDVLVCGPLAMRTSGDLGREQRERVQYLQRRCIRGRKIGQRLAGDASSSKTSRPKIGKQNLERLIVHSPKLYAQIWLELPSQRPESLLHCR